MAVLTHAPMLGAPTDTSMRVWVRTDQAASVLIQYQPTGGDWSSPSETAAHSMVSGDDYTHNFSITGLTANTIYDYRPKVDGVADTGNASTLKTFKTAGAAGTFSFTTCGDTRNSDSPFTLFDAMDAHSPDFLIHQGDAFYGNLASPNNGSLVPTTEAEFMACYLLNRDANTQAMGKHIPFIGQWDNHDYGNNIPPNLNKALARAAFGKIWPNSDFVETDGAIYRKFTVCDCEFFIIDRCWDQTAYTDPSPVILSTAQMNWLKAQLLASTAKFKFICSGVMMGDFDTVLSHTTWQYYPVARADLLNYIANNNIRNVIFLSGDQHWAYQILIDWPANSIGTGTRGFYELGATPLGQAAVANSTSTNYQLLYSAGSNKYYGRIAVDTTASPATVTMEVRRSAAATLTWSLTVHEYMEPKRRVLLRR